MSLTENALCDIMRLPQVRQPTCGDLNMKTNHRKYQVVTAIMVIEAILSIIYITRELLR